MVNEMRALEDALLRVLRKILKMSILEILEAVKQAQGQGEYLDPEVFEELLDCKSVKADLDLWPQVLELLEYTAFFQVSRFREPVLTGRG